ncbi:unnamed protein product [Eretmochelys imbricata]
MGPGGDQPCKPAAQPPQRGLIPTQRSPGAQMDPAASPSAGAPQPTGHLHGRDGPGTAPDSASRSGVAAPPAPQGPLAAPAFAWSSRQGGAAAADSALSSA